MTCARCGQDDQIVLSMGDGRYQCGCGHAAVHVLDERQPTWMVVRKRETDPPEVWSFWGAGAEVHAVRFHDRAQAQWSECFLVRVVKQGTRGV